ncbi:MAG: hypothetical protein A2749_00085 [Parcubacteria group bacterium RIFCSPHIGHO2_01_FULL_45_26]|nr:MAG: hypothetical protein A2749_00085 [Parcubacteria group bacterium RIFCSPHIGHO2_01_FULL_45_26]
MSNNLATSSKIEALLFYKNEPLGIAWLAKTLGMGIGEISHGLDDLREKLKGRGIVLLEVNETVAIGTAPETSELIEKMRKEELAHNIGRAGLETLSIVVYRAPISRATIDYIRGVNSQFILRNLLERGLIDKIPDVKDGRVMLYRPTTELFSYLGVKNVDEIPDYVEINKKLDVIQTEKD